MANVTWRFHIVSRVEGNKCTYEKYLCPLCSKDGNLETDQRQDTFKCKYFKELAEELQCTTKGRFTEVLKLTK